MKKLFLLCIACSITVAYGEQPAQQPGPAKTHDVYKGIDNPKKLTVAVTDFEGKGLAEGEPKTLTDAFRSYLINTGRFRVMERGQMDDILKEQGFQSSGACTDQACMVEMGQLLGVDNILAGSVGKVGATYSINVRLISVETGEIVKSTNRFHKGEIDGVLTEVLPAVANDLIDQGGVTAPRPIESVVKMNPVPKDENGKKEVKKRKKGLVWAGLGAGVVAAGGGVAVYFLTQKKDDGPVAGAQTGRLDISWE
jgi:TolB-like protein